MVVHLWITVGASHCFANLQTLQWKYTKQNHITPNHKDSIKVSPRLVASDVSAQIIPRDVNGGFSVLESKLDVQSSTDRLHVPCLMVSSMLQVYKCNQRLNSKSWATRSCRGAIRHN